MGPRGSAVSAWRGERDVFSPREAARRLGDWGFLAHPDLPDAPGPAYLVVAIRPSPTLRHFDPVSIQYWRTIAGRGVTALLDIATPLPLNQPFAWGEIRVLDRFRVSNEYATFGGRVTADRVGDATVAVFESRAPILRRGGHSQLADQAAADVSAFFARLVNAVGASTGLAEPAPETLEATLGSAAPHVLYAAFLEDAAARLRRSASLRLARSDFAVLVGAERARVIRLDPSAVTAGHELLIAAGLLEPSASPGAVSAV